MQTPEEHLSAAEDLLIKAQAAYAATAHAPASEIVALANAHVTLALAINAIPLLGELGGELHDLRHNPYQHQIDEARQKYWNQNP